ncbi:RNA-dependent DNA polymerase [Shewanella sp. Scap07]|uniref:reverse transcriptase domain-containing protein n=1 Tax=Shewanella sp. Scap07 TaxID=2589987 RepID=UPI0015B7AF47|nr:reverse transcriptase domain-containing protein [Shewanella sp. Scap07]QLE85415.1 RNA-dependent DNA polymerase [Shewanella sp. Scap07]
MKVQDQFNKEFEVDNLKELFTDYVVYSGATGIDNLNQYAFRKQLDSQTEILSRKAKDGSYQFTKYKLKLISKGRNKVPREISIPTVRDRIALKAMCRFLQERFKSAVEFKLPQNVIKEVKSDIDTQQYDSYIKLDVSNFYPSIKHDILLKQLRKRVRIKPILDFITSAICSPTVSVSRPNDEPTELGIPQGLAISNILAAIYLQNIDKYLSTIPNAKCYRYVDDVLILCQQHESKQIADEVIRKFKDVGLTVHCPTKSPEKSKIDTIRNGFDYLGYDFRADIISARNGTIENLKSSLAGIFTSHKHVNSPRPEFLEWRLNLRITGCIFENKSKGWLFFFSEINDEQLLHRLDHYVSKLCKRFDVNVVPKKFVRSFKEITHRKYETTYVPNFDDYDTAKMSEVLIKYFGYELKGLSATEIKYEFHKKIGSQVKDLEVDIKDFSY